MSEATKPTNLSSPSLFLKWLGLAAVLIALDQMTKFWIVARYPQEGMGDVITSFFNLVRVHNHGAAFSFLADAGGWQRWFFTVLALAVSAFIIWMLKKGEGSRLSQLAFTLILAGALGNVIDRILYGYVVDFLDFHASWLEFLFYKGHYPAFNVADTCITVGAILMVAAEFFQKDSS